MDYIADLSRQVREQPAPSGITARVFMVGCPRSGTTLAQSLLTAHPQVFSVPESHLYSRLTSRNRLLRRLGLVRHDAPRVFESMMQSLSLPATRPRGVTTRFYLRAFARLLDEATLAAYKRVWLEKTPRHLYYLPELERTLAQAKFIHMLRDGADVVASLFEVTQQYPEIWGGARSIDTCIDRWNKDVALSHRYRDEPNHLLVRYEDLTANPEASLREIFAFIGLSFVSGVLENYQTTTRRRVIVPGEAWKGAVGGRIERTQRHKLSGLFSPARQVYILERTRFGETKPSAIRRGRRDRDEFTPCHAAPFKTKDRVT